MDEATKIREANYLKNFPGVKEVLEIKTPFINLTKKGVKHTLKELNREIRLVQLKITKFGERSDVRSKRRLTNFNELYLALVNKRDSIERLLAVTNSGEKDLSNNTKSGGKTTS